MLSVRLYIPLYCIGDSGPSDGSNIVAGAVVAVLILIVIIIVVILVVVWFIR